MKYLSSLANWKLILGILGLYHETKFGAGGNIYLPLLAVLVTIACLKYLV